MSVMVTREPVRTPIQNVILENPQGNRRLTLTPNYDDDSAIVKVADISQTAVYFFGGLHAQSIMLGETELRELTEALQEIGQEMWGQC